MGQAADRDGAAVGVDQLFDNPAFASLKSLAAVFVAVRPSTRDVIWANRAAVGFWDCSPERLKSVLFGPPGGGWLGTSMSAVVPGRPPQVFRTGLAPGLGMRGTMVLARALGALDGTPIVGFAVPAAGTDGAAPDAWRRGAGSDIEAPALEMPEPSGSQDGDLAGAILVRRSRTAVLRDRLMAAADGAAQLRFLWRTDAGGVVTAIDDKLPSRLGAPFTTGAEPLPEAVARFDAPAGERLGHAFATRSTWSSLAVRLPVAGGVAIVPTLLSGSPVFGRERAFQGFRGFGVVDLSGLEITPREARPPAEAVRLAAAETASFHAAPEDMASTTAQDDAAPDRPATDPGQRSSPADAREFQETSEPIPLTAVPETESTDYGTERAPFANVVDLRSFQAVRSAPPTVQEPLPQEPPAPEIPPDASSSEGAPVSDEIAFLALGAALRARIGGTGIDEREHGTAPSDESQPAAAAAGDAGSRHHDATARPAASEAVALLESLPIPVLVVRDGEPAFANQTAARVLGVEAPGAIVGIGPHFDADGLPSGVTLRNGRGEPVTIAAESTLVDWQGAAATLWVLRPGPVAEAQPKTSPAPRSEGDERPVDLIDRVDDAVALLDGEGRIRRLNERGRGWFDGGTVGESITALLAPESRASALQLLEEARSRGEGSAAAPPRREVLARTAALDAMPMLLTLGRLGSSGFYATLRDVSALRRAERDEARSRGERERDAGRLPDLLARVSHEIRTPLNAILGFAEVMMDERFGPLGSPRYREYLKDIHASGTQVVTLVDDLLDLSRIEAGRLDLDVGAVDVNKVVAELVAQMQPEANRGRVIVRTSLASRIPSVLADERSARQIVQHLLSNAVKFNEPGGQVIVSTAQEESGAVLLRIRDTGVGMTEAEIAAALEPFHDVSPPRPTNGNGLGLPLARALVGANGASLSIRSRPREGTLVEVSFPPAPPEDARRPA